MSAYAVNTDVDVEDYVGCGGLQEDLYVALRGVENRLLQEMQKAGDAPPVVMIFKRDEFMEHLVSAGINFFFKQYRLYEKPCQCDPMCSCQDAARSTIEQDASPIVEVGSIGHLQCDANKPIALVDAAAQTTFTTTVAEAAVQTTSTGTTRSSKKKKRGKRGRGKTRKQVPFWHFPPVWPSLPTALPVPPAPNIPVISPSPPPENMPLLAYPPQPAPPSFKALQQVALALAQSGLAMASALLTTADN